MADTIREKIMADLETAMNAIDGTGNYNNAIDSIQRWEESGNDLTAKSTIILAGGDEVKEYGPSPLKTATLSVELSLWLRHDKDDFPGSTDAYLNSWLGDMERAAMVDITRGGNAQQTDVLGSIPFETAEGAHFAGIMLQLEVQYRHNVYDPESLV